MDEVKSKKEKAPKAKKKIGEYVDSVEITDIKTETNELKPLIVTTPEPSVKAVDTVSINNATVAKPSNTSPTDIPDTSKKSPGEIAKYPVIKRMIGTLDKFLSRHIASVAVIYFGVMIICSAVLIMGGVNASAHSGGSGSGGYSPKVWIYSIIATVTLLFILIVVRVVTMRIAKNKNK